MLPVPVEPAGMCASDSLAYITKNNSQVQDNSSSGMVAALHETSNDRNEEAQCADALRLLEDYPEPLTATQRESLHRHTAALVRRFTAVRKGTRVIERGYRSLLSLLSRLEGERSRLQASLDNLLKPDETPTQASTTTEQPQRPTATVTAAPGGSSSRRTGGLLRSAAFANLHNVLNAAKREEQERHRLNITLEREKIGKMAQLKIIEDDLAEQKGHLEPLADKYQKSDAILKAMQAEVIEALRLYEEMQRMEVAYASRFFLHASGSQEGDDGAEAVMYDVFFVPAKFTEEVQDMIREQVEETLDEYLSYRRRVDPLLESLAEERRHREEKRADQLLRLIGVDTSGTAVGTTSDLALTPQLTLTTAPVTFSVLSAKKDGSAGAGQISDAEEEDDNDDEDDTAGEPQEKKQRDQIQSALAALDDFEDLY
ncbi:hypothetical protein DQ04_03941040 [Trypanosoma grayi]|uniref:hypothetical protein n=1 Tax=Trypanosoma grayi TaxID=71804 RepID=UPI0004F4941C|nr:hypothetical protein DQ04_03941040 [Trypanosoma grayi]KEG10278.1 hypothetical protein DQ04_03941040 [Trypanosoma grayi]